MSINYIAVTFLKQHTSFSHSALISLQTIGLKTRPKIGILSLAGMEKIRLLSFLQGLDLRNMSPKYNSLEYGSGFIQRKSWRTILSMLNWTDPQYSRSGLCKVSQMSLERALVEMSKLMHNPSLMPCIQIKLIQEKQHNISNSHGWWSADLLHFKLAHIHKD